MMIRKSRPMMTLVALFVVLLLGSAQPAAAWSVDLEASLKEAQAQNKMLLIDFYAEWCRFCTMMNTEVFQKKAFQELVADHFVLVSIDADQQRDIVQKYQVQGFPTVVFLDPAGEEIRRIVGYRTRDDFFAAIRSIIARKEKTPRTR